MRHFSISIKNKFKYFSILKTRQIALSFYCSIPIIFLLLYLNLVFAISLGQPISSNAIQKYFSLIILISVSCLFSFFCVFYTGISCETSQKERALVAHCFESSAYLLFQPASNIPFSSSSHNYWLCSRLWSTDKDTVKIKIIDSFKQQQQHRNRQRQPQHQ